MADFKLRSPPRLRMAAGFQIAGTFGLTDVPVQLAGSAIARAQSTAALLRGVNLGGAAAASAQATAALVRGIRMQSAAVASASASGSLNWSIVPEPVFVFGANDTYDLRDTPPSGFVAGGKFIVSHTGAQLPSGLSLAESGVISDVGAALSTTYGVVFGYYEPGALPTLTLHTGIVDGNLPYMATIYPLEGVVPSGQSIASPDDINLRASVLSVWPDGSAQVVVVAGQKSVSTGSTYPIRLQPGAPGGSALTTAAIASAFSSGIVFTNFGGGTQTLNSWGVPDRIWWANPQVICARYRQSLGVGALEAVIDVHAFAGGRAFVEVVIENGAVNPSSPTRPADQTYTGATVSVNGTTIETVSTSSSFWGTHQAFSAWYCSTWIGGDPGIEVTHDIASMQAHPLLFKIEQASALNFQTWLPVNDSGSQRTFNGVWQPYASDAYTPWSYGRQRWPDMGAGADAAAIGPLPQWEAHYLQTGDKYCRRAVIESALSILTYVINYRSTATGLVPSHTECYGKSTQGGTWPDTGNQFGNRSEGEFEVAHEPAVGLMAFLCRPSPCFIEIAQKIAHLNAVAQQGGDQLFGFWFQTRGKAWCFRNLAHATFLTPTQVSGDPNVAAWRTAAAANIGANVSFFLQWRASSEDKLNFLWEYSPTNFTDHGGVQGDGFQFPVWEHHFLAPELFKAYNAKLVSGTDQTNLATLVDWALSQPVRWVNEQANGGWRYIGYRTTVGTVDGDNTVTMGQLADWGTMRAWRNPTTPPTVSGPFYTQGSNDPVTYLSGWTQENGNSGLQYVEPFWTALVAAVERDVAGAATAWATVTSNVTNLATFKAWAGTDPRHISYPRNV